MTHMARMCVAQIAGGLCQNAEVMVVEDGKQV